MAEYTPTTEQVREGYAEDPVADYHDPFTDHAASGRRAFDRWLAEHDREVRAEVLREAADRLLAGLNENPLLRGLVSINGGAQAMRDYAVESLREDADRIAAGEGV